MGVASPSTKRRLGSPEDDEVVSAKIARKLNNNNNDITLSLQDTTGNENSSDFLTTSILARTLLTTSSSGGNSPQFVGVGGNLLCPASYAFTPDPLESLKSSLEALPAPDIRPFFLSDKSTILSDASDLEFSGLLCHERPLELASSVVTVLSPIDTTESSPASNKSSSSSSAFGQHNQLITEDENGKSYFNLGSSDATIVARKSSRSSSLDHHGNSGGGWSNNNNCLTNLHGGNLNGPSSSSNDFDDNASSSSCESISSEDLFNSGEEFDASDDEEDELCSYKQQRSTVLHLSLCKLNKFRSVSKQQCVEPSLHRSVLICNTLRHIEQEIKNEDEVDESLKSREKLPSFWRSGSNHCFSNNPPPPSHNQPQITDTRPNVLPNNNNSTMNPTNNGLLSPNGHDPYLSSPNPYSEAPYLSYDYNSLRPTPYHTTSYEYGEHDLPSSNNASPVPQQQLQASSSEIIVTSSTSPLLECDSGYGDDLDLSSYYYVPPPPPPSVQSPMTSLIAPPPQPPPTPMDTSSSCSPNDQFIGTPSPQAVSQVASNNNNNSISSNSNNGSSSNSSPSSNSGSVSGNISPPHHSPTTAYLHCGGFTSTLGNAPAPPTNSPGAINDDSSAVAVLMSGEMDSLAKSDLSDSRSTDVISSPNSSLTVLSCHPNRSPPHGAVVVSTSSSSSNSSACDYLGRDFNGENVQSMELGRAEHDQVCWTSSKSDKDLGSTGSSSNDISPSNDCGEGGVVSVVPVTSASSSLIPSPPGVNCNNNNNNNVTFAQQESQCGIESRRSELSISSNHFSNHNLPMENLISSTYSSSL